MESFVCNRGPTPEEIEIKPLGGEDPSDIDCTALVSVLRLGREATLTAKLAASRFFQAPVGLNHHTVLVHVVEDGETPPGNLIAV